MAKWNDINPFSLCLYYGFDFYDGWQMGFFMSVSVLAVDSALVLSENNCVKRWNCNEKLFIHIEINRRIFKKKSGLDT